MRILLIYPNLDAPAGSNHGVASLAGVLKARGHEMDLWQVCEKLEPVPTSAEIVDYIRETKPGLVGFSVLSMQYDWVVAQSKAIRAAFPDLKQIIGGVHCTMVPDEVHDSKLFDFVCIGEGDYSLADVMDALEKGTPTDKISGIRLWKGDEKIINPVAPFPALDTLPDLDYEVFDMPKILEQTKGWMGILTSRGCPYKCTYCFNLEIVDQYVADGAAKGPKEFLRMFPIDRQIAELKDLRRRYPQIKTFIFDDDLFTLNKPYVQKFCKYQYHTYHYASTGRYSVLTTQRTE